jgi:hypothetical protein
MQHLEILILFLNSKSFPIFVLEMKKPNNTFTF